MWKFVSCGNSNGKPLLDTVNDHIGRQYWEFDATVGTPEERAEVERLRTAFTANRHKKRDSDDALIRLQAKQRIVEANIRVPSLPIDKTAPLDEDRINQHLTAAIKFYECLQAEDGHWPGDYAGPMFLLPGLVIAAYVTKSLDVAFPEEHRKEVLRYLKNHQNLDGGFGLHIEGQSCMFGTSLKCVRIFLRSKALNGLQLYRHAYHGNGGGRGRGRPCTFLGKIASPFWKTMFLSFRFKNMKV